ncbi:hypothetical protein CH373_00150 [Leptospira perolatii]|uniref:Uncharacterized protein n=1 Tax=Leptospira perolatii TaxID=2023191 RepID=A0A2M9ZRC9_9LEPT|nr:hypothetical protein [Leptospira perolatii]PJZ70987.1 hypothetical protein CH360_00150 [Leptospira perolatii]PJZ74519.1 hypothetical protein CH373_00150 [Leptospira perolatii]
MIAAIISIALLFVSTSHSSANYISGFPSETETENAWNEAESSFPEWALFQIIDQIAYWINPKELLDLQFGKVHLSNRLGLPDFTNLVLISAKYINLPPPSFS